MPGKNHNGRPRPALASLAAFSLLTGLALASCATFAGKRLEVFTHGGAGERWASLWIIDGISVEPPLPGAATEAEATRLLAMLGTRHGVKVSAKQASYARDETFLLIDLWLHEQQYTRGYETLNAVAVILSLKDPVSSGALIEVFFSEDTRATLSSSTYLYRILEEVLAALFRKLDREPKRQERSGA